MTLFQPYEDDNQRHCLLRTIIPNYSSAALVAGKQARLLFSCADVIFLLFIFLFQYLAVAARMGTQQLRATPPDRAVSAQAQALSALPQASKREMDQRGKGRQRETSTPATGKGLCFPLQDQRLWSAGVFVEGRRIGAGIHGAG